MWRGLTLTQPAPRRPAAYGAVEVLDHDALVAGGDQLVEERLRLLRARRSTERGTTKGSGGEPPAAVRTARGRQVDQVVAVDVQQRRRRTCVSGTSARSRATSRLLAVRAPVSWNGRGRPRRRARSPRRRGPGPRPGSAATASTTSGTRSVISSRLRVNTAHLAVAAVHLDPDAVELAVHDGAPAPDGPASGRRRHLGPRPRASAAPAGPPRGRSPPAPATPPGQRGDRSGPGMPGEHHGAAHGGLGHVGGGGDRLEHHAVEGPLAQLAGDQPAEEVLLGCSRLGEERLHRGGPRRGGADAAQGSHGLQPAVHHGQRQGGRGGRRGQRPEAAPAHADASLREDPGEVGRGRGHLLGSRRTQGAGQRLDLRGARPGGGGGRGHGHQLAQEHGHPAVTRARPPAPPTPCRGRPRRGRR